MSTTGERNSEAAGEGVKEGDLKLEVVVIPVADVDRAKEFYGRLGWRLDADFPFDNGFRVVQFTPPGSGTSVQFGALMTPAAPGSAQGLYLVVSDIEAARGQLSASGAEVSRSFSSPRPVRPPTRRWTASRRSGLTGSVRASRTPTSTRPNASSKRCASGWSKKTRPTAPNRRTRPPDRITPRGKLTGTT
jgi:predicted enzyme related to lactoylglutathione lyase